ncbi:MAG: hypothetical protein Kow0025_17290 [Thermodesulfovibrionales bacterium]
MTGREPDWVRASKESKRSLFSELDVLLRSLDRFFAVDYLPSSVELTADKGFSSELDAARNAVLRVLEVLDAVIPENRKNAYWFQRFAESKFLSEARRNRFKEELYRQETPDKSLYLLYDSFISLKALLGDLLRTSDINYASFRNIGHLVSRQVRENVHFNPFRHEVDPELDVIDNAEIARLVKAISDPEVKKTLSTVFLHLFRFLRYMRHMHFSTDRLVLLHSSVLALMLLRSELNLFRAYLEKVTPRLLDHHLAGELEAVSYQFAMESKRVFLQELKDIFEQKSHAQLRGRIENSHGILKNLTEQAIIQLARLAKPDIRGEDIFELFSTRAAQSVKLREDLTALHKFLGLLGGNGQAPERRQEVLSSLLNYMEYFESFTFKLLRYDDYEEFVSFFDDIKAAGRNSEALDSVTEKCSHFRIFLETTLRQIANRAELRDRPLDVENVDDIIRQYISIN